MLDLELRANHKKFHEKNSKVVLFISHFHEIDDRAILACPFLHVLY